MKRENVLLVLLLVISVYLTAYTTSAHLVSSHIVEKNGKSYWCSGPEGSLWPWPSKNSKIGIPILIELNGTDSFIYNYLIKTYLLSIVCASLWLSVIFLVYKKAKTAKPTLSQ